MLERTVSSSGKARGTLLGVLTLEAGDRKVVVDVSLEGSTGHLGAYQCLSIATKLFSVRGSHLHPPIFPTLHSH